MIVSAVTRVHNPRTSRRRTSRRRRAHNPIPQLVTLGVINPKRKETMKRTRKRSSSKRRNPMPVHRRRRYAAKRRNPVSMSRHRRRSHRRRNPRLASMGGGGIQSIKLVLGGLIGVAVTKMLSGMIARAMPSLQSPLVNIAVAGASAYGAGMLASKVDAGFGDAVAFGGYMQTGSTALSAFAPGLGIGLGAIVPGRFAVPENVVMRGAIASLPAAAGGGVSGYNRGRY